MSARLCGPAFALMILGGRRLQEGVCLCWSACARVQPPHEAAIRSLRVRTQVSVSLRLRRCWCPRVSVRLCEGAGVGVRERG